MLLQLAILVGVEASKQIETVEAGATHFALLNIIGSGKVSVVDKGAGGFMSETFDPKLASHAVGLPIPTKKSVPLFTKFKIRKLCQKL